MLRDTSTLGGTRDRTSDLPVDSQTALPPEPDAAPEKLRPPAGSSQPWTRPALLPQPPPDEGGGGLRPPLSGRPQLITRVNEDQSACLVRSSAPFFATYFCFRNFFNVVVFAKAHTHTHTNTHTHTHTHILKWLTFGWKKYKLALSSGISVGWGV